VTPESGGKSGIVTGLQRVFGEKNLPRMQPDIMAAGNKVQVANLLYNARPADH
jgi:hypothetical protein